MQQSNIEWHNEQEQVVGKRLDKYLYPQWIRKIKRKYKNIQWHRDHSAKQQNIPNHLDIKLDHKNYQIDEYFIFGTQDSVYLKVSEDKIKPLPRRRIYSYLFEPNDTENIPFFAVCQYDEEVMSDISLSVYDYGNLEQLLEAIGLSKTLLYNKTKQMISKKIAYESYEQYDLYYCRFLRSRPIYLKICRKLFEEYANYNDEVKKK